MKIVFGLAALAAALPAAPAGAQFHGGTPLQQAASVYGECVYARARSARQSGASADSAIASGFSKCKGERKRTLNATRARIAAAGIKGEQARLGAQSMIESGDRMMADTLRQEFAAAAAAPK
ncbi:MAG TPA: hypothetical protein VFR28_08300 [Allosphingosinicella sp.]|jgi:hypothetical protein|nr:hypothetical protein [Allosphingosinicella sp.]